MPRPCALAGFQSSQMRPLSVLRGSVFMEGLPVESRSLCSAGTHSLHRRTPSCKARREQRVTQRCSVHVSLYHLEEHLVLRLGLGA